MTLRLSAVTIVCGLLIGALAAAMRIYGGWTLSAMSASYVEVIRNTPLIVQLFLVFFGLPGLGVRLDAMTASLIALAFNLGAYTAETYLFPHLRRVRGKLHRINDIGCDGQIFASTRQASDLAAVSAFEPDLRA